MKEASALYSIAIASAGLCLAMSAPAAVADDSFCATVEGIHGLAYDDFRHIADGPFDAGSGSTRTSLVLPGAETCEILRSDDHSGYWCSWSSTRNTLHGQVQAFAERIGDCLGSEPDWTGNEYSPSAFIFDRGVEFYVRGSEYGGAFKIQLAVEFVGDEVDPPDWHTIVTDGRGRFGYADASFLRNSPEPKSVFIPIGSDNISA
jgi:hypothetical protein